MMRSREKVKMKGVGLFLSSPKFRSVNERLFPTRWGLMELYDDDVRRLGVWA